MKLSIVIIGDEILLGRVTDTNSGLIAREFSAAGWQVNTVRTVGDNADDIRAAILLSVDESDLTITTGGLGPTRDDITKNVFTDIFGGELVVDDSVTKNIETIFARRNITLNKLTLAQALVPTSCRVVQNRFGTAPLMWFEKEGHVAVAMPGVPYETRGMLGEVLSLVTEHFGTAELALHREFTVTGISESALAEHLAAFEDGMPAGYKLAYLPSAGQILLRLDSPHGASAQQFDSIAQQLKNALGPRLASEGKSSPAQLLLHKLRNRRMSLATAESCTGGNIAHCITAIAGSSDTFRGSVVAYANEVKTALLGVSAQTLDTDGAVSRATVEQMTAGACRACQADCAIATSGIAGPGGATPDKPVGTVWIGARTPLDHVERLFHFDGDRQAVIERATATALNLLGELL